MEWIKYTAPALSAVSMVLGLTGLFLAFLVPRALDGAFMRGMFTGPYLEPHRRHRVLVSLSSLLLGAFIWLNVSQYLLAALIVFAVWLPVALAVIRASARARSVALRG